MTSGFSKGQAGVTEALMETYGELIFELSHNVQVRRGDPVRLKDFDDYERQRAEFGLADTEIAERLGLTKTQVTVIRNAVERRKIRTEPYYRLNSLGGGRRFRSDSLMDATTKTHPTKHGLALKATMTFDPERARHYIDMGYWRGDTMSQWLARHLRERPDAPAIIDDDQTLSWAAVGERVQDVAGGLRALGIGEADVVAVQLPNVAAYIIAFLAIAELRAVMTTVYMPYREKEFLTLLGHSHARALICLSEAGDFRPAETALSLKAGLPELEQVISVEQPVEGCVFFDDLAAPAGRQADLEPPVATDPLLLLYTSGTTASPKGVPLNQHVLLSNVTASVSENGFGPEDRFLSAAPFGHLFALYAIHFSLATGAANVLLPAFSPPALSAAMASHKPTVLLAAPAHIAACLGLGLFDKGEAASLKLTIMSGAQIPPQLVHAFAQKLDGGTISQLWGMSEIQAGAYTRPGTPLDKVAASAGPAGPGSEIRVVDETGAVLASGEEGELQTRGINVFASYYDNDEANAQAFTEDGWFRTGDLATIDADGCVSLTGRSKDIINRGGVKYNPLDIERLLDRHEDIAVSAIAPVPDAVLGERACAYVVLAGDQPVSLEQICGYLSDHGIAKTKLPERLEIIDEMPLTATRKIIKGRLKPTE